jgi:hypothetical protein
MPAIKSLTARKPLTIPQFRNFLFAGRSVFTLENKETKNYITFKVRNVKDRNKNIIPGRFSVQCKALGDKFAGYNFIGFIDLISNEFRPRYAGVSKHLGFKVFWWVLKNFERLEDFEEKLGIYHEGICCKCSMPLTTPESIEKGIGPICEERVLGKSIELMKEVGTYDPKLSYDDNCRKAIKADASLWGKLILSDEVQKAKENKVHRMFENLKCW